MEHRKLTHREKSCLFLAALGKSSQQTAEILNITIETVNSHRKKIKRKLNSSNMAHAVFKGVSFGYLKKCSEGL